MPATRKAVKDHSVPELPKQPQTGDRIRLKESSRFVITKACEAAGWTIDPDEVRVVTRTDPYLPGGGTRLFVDGPPFAFSPRDVELAWKDGDQGAGRREALRARGWRV